MRIHVLLALFLAPSAVFAQVYVGPSQYNSGASNERPVTSQSWALEFKFSPYLPALDNDPTLPEGETPFADIFGDKRKLMFRTELEYQALRLGPVGTLGAGFGVGAFQVKGLGLDADGNPTEDVNKFRVFPFALDAVLRIDYLLSKKVPLAPFAKGGFDMYYWNNRKNGEFTKFPSGNNVQGTTLGFHGAFGLAFDLGVLDPNGAVNMDHNFGVNRSFLFAAAEFTRVNDFNSGQSFDFSSTLLNVGITAEF
jgi:hypothetical protein